MDYMAIIINFDICNRLFLCPTIYMQIHVHMLFNNRCPSIIYHLKEAEVNRIILIWDEKRHF